MRSRWTAIEVGHEPWGATLVDDLYEDEQVAFKGNAKAFTRTYGFLATILLITEQIPAAVARDPAYRRCAGR